MTNNTHTSKNISLQDINKTITQVGGNLGVDPGYKNTACH